MSFLAAAMIIPDQAQHLSLLYAKILAATTFDHLVRHPIVTVGDFDDERLTDPEDRLLDARHAEIEETIDWFFRIARRHEVLWFDVSLDPARVQPVRLRSRPPSGPIEEWIAPGGDLSQQLAQCLDLWLDARRLPRAGALTPFALADLHAAVAHLDRALLAGRATDANPKPTIPPSLMVPPPRLGIPFLRALGDMSTLDDHDVDPVILRIDPSHPVARRNEFLYALRSAKDADRRAILPVVAEAPMYGKPHLSVWGDAFELDRPDENMGLRHQGLAAALLPSNPYACHNYALQLNDEYRREESHRWADRATVASPGFNNAHLDCVRRLRQVFRPGQAFAEAQYRCNDILTRWREGQISPFEWPAKYHAGMLLALTHADIGRLDEAIRIGEDTMRDLADPEGGHESFGWATKRIAQWKSDPTLLASAYAWEGYHRSDPGRVIAGFGRGRIQDADDAVMMMDALISLGREDLALVAFHQFLGAGMIGDGKARLIGAKLHILRGDLDQAIEHLLIVELRRGQSRLESEINRVLRLACVRSPDEWNAVIARLYDRGARRLARMAARDLADFVPGLDAGVCARAFGSRDEWTLDPAWLGALRAALPAMSGNADAIDLRLADPHDHSLAAADALGQEWWTVLSPPNKDRDGHAAGALYALGVALARYLALASSSPTPLAGRLPPHRDRGAAPVSARPLPDRRSRHARYAPTKPRGRGTGLGLAIARDIVERCGGTIDVDSELGRGSRFAVVLPIEINAGTVAPVAEPAAPLAHVRLLIIDDEVALTTALRRQLRHHHEVAVANDGATALALVEREPFDVVLCDITMPDMDGLAVHAALARRHPRLASRVVFMSGGLFTDAARDAISSLGVPVLAKPVPIDSLLDAIEVARQR